MRIFYCLYFFFFLQYENFVNGMFNRTPSVSSSSHKNTNEDKGKAKMKEQQDFPSAKMERNGKKILFVARNIHFSNYQIFVNLANKLDDSGYIVHLIIVYERPKWMKRENELVLPKLNPDILYISIPMIDFFTSKTIFTQNLRVEIKREEQPILQWLSGQNYSMGMADIEFLNKALDLFDLLKIRGSILVSVPPLYSIYLHLLGMSLPKTIPEFSRAIPGDGNGKSGIRKPFSERQKENIKQYHDEIKLDASVLSINSEQFAKQVRYVLVNQHPLAQFHQLNRSPSPFVKFIGGIHVEEFAHKLKEDSNRKMLYPESDCLVLFSVGTLKSISQQEAKFVNIIFTVFTAYPNCHFIVNNFDEKNMPAHERKQILKQSKNIEIVQGFVQQREILAQPNLRLFISHCGQNSLNEAVYFGVPIMCIPFSFDQFYNAAIVEFLGNGKFLKNDKIDETLPEALNEMLEMKNNKYRIVAQKLKEMIMDYPKRSDEFISVVDKAILELEQNEMPNLTVKSATEGFTFDSPILDDNFVLKENKLSSI